MLPVAFIFLTLYSQDESSEKFIGEWAEARGNRDQLFIATKVRILLNMIATIHKHWRAFSQYTFNFKARDESVHQKVLYVGNNAKSLHISVEQSLKKLRTSYIDLLYLHWWDWDTSIEEVMRSLHTLVLQGKVLYLVSFVLLFFLVTIHLTESGQKN